MSSPVRPRPPGVDELLQDYLRIINEKDTEILDLVSKVQGLDTELRKTEERAKARVKGLKESAQELQSEAESAVRRITDAENLVGSLQKERDELRADVETLRDAMYRQDHDLRAALRASEKAQKQDAAAVQDLHHELESKKRDSNEQISSLDHRLQQTSKNLRDADEERNNLLKECAALQSRLEDREGQLRELKRRAKTLVPKEEVVNEMRAVEARANAEVSAAVRELERLRAEHVEEVHRGQRREAALQEAREEARRLEGQINDTRRISQETEMRSAQSQVVNAQRIEEMRADLAVAHDKIGNLEGVRAQLEQDRSSLQLRFEENKRIAQNNDLQTRGDIERLRDKTLEQNAEVESLKRVVQQQDQMIQQARERADRIQEERANEVRALREDVVRYQTAAQQSSQIASSNEKVMVQMRDEGRREHEGRLAAEKQIRDLDGALNSFRHRCGTQGDEITQLSNSVAELRREREEGAVRTSRAENAFRDSQEDIRKLRIEIEHMAADAHRLEAAAAHERAERNRCEGRNNADTLTIQRLENELSDRDTRLSAAQSALTTSEAQRRQAADELNRVRDAVEQITSDSRRDRENDQGQLRRLAADLEDMSHRLSNAELARDEQAKALQDSRSRENQTHSLLQSVRHELQAANERAANAEELRSALDKQNQALQRQSAELTNRVEELRGSYHNLQGVFDKQSEQLQASMRRADYQQQQQQQQQNNNNNTTLNQSQIHGGNSNAGGGASSSVAGSNNLNPATPLNVPNTAAASPVGYRNQNGTSTPISAGGLDNISVLPARGPSLYSSSAANHYTSRGGAGGAAGSNPFSPSGMYTSVLAGGGGASPSALYGNYNNNNSNNYNATSSSNNYSSSRYFGGAGIGGGSGGNTQSVNVSPSRRVGSPQPRGY